MAIVLISYFSKSGNTKKMADCIKEGLDSLGGVEGVQQGNHYGPVSVGAPDEGARDECRRYGKMIGELVKRLS